MIKVRLKFSKANDLRWLSHLEISRAWHRIINRAGLQIAYSAGYSPHPKIAFSPALPVGIGSEAEYADMVLTRPMPIDELLGKVNAAAPAGIKASRAKEVAPRTPTLGASIKFADYRLTISEFVEKSDIAKALKRSELGGCLSLLSVDKQAGETILSVRLPTESKLNETVVSIGELIGIKSDLILVDRIAQWALVDDSLVDPMDVE